MQHSFLLYLRLLLQDRSAEEGCGGDGEALQPNRTSPSGSRTLQVSPFLQQERYRKRVRTQPGDLVLRPTVPLPFRKEILLSLCGLLSLSTEIPKVGSTADDAIKLIMNIILVCDHQHHHCCR